MARHCYWVENIALKVWHINACMPKYRATEEHQNKQVDQAARSDVAQVVIDIFIGCSKVKTKPFYCNTTQSSCQITTRINCMLSFGHKNGWDLSISLKNICIVRAIWSHLVICLAIHQFSHSFFLSGRKMLWVFFLAFSATDSLSLKTKLLLWSLLIASFISCSWHFSPSSSFVFQSSGFFLSKS